MMWRVILIQETETESDHVMILPAGSQLFFPAFLLR